MPGWPVHILGDTDAHFGFQARAMVAGFFPLLFTIRACSRVREVVCPLGGRQGPPRCAKGRVFRDEGPGTLQPPGVGACSSCRKKKKLQEKSVCTGDLKSNRFNLQGSS